MYLLARDQGQAWDELFKDGMIDRRLQKALGDAQTAPLAKAFIRETRRAAFLEQILAQAEVEGATTADRKQALAAARDVAPRATKDQARKAAKRIAAIAEADPSILRDGMSAMASLPFNVAQPYLDGVMSEAKKYDVSQRRDALHLLGRTEQAQRKLLERVENREIPQDLMLDVAEMLHRSRWERIRKVAAETIPRPSDSQGKTLPPIGELVKLDGDPARGRIIFMDDQRAQCNRCHIVEGLGRNVGPDLSKIGEKLSRQALYEAILNPSAAIAHEYEVYVLETEWDGDYVGFIQRESDTHVDIIDAAGEVNHVAKPDIVTRRRNPLSLMPAGLAAAMTAEELTDLVAYLETLK